MLCSGSCWWCIAQFSRILPVRFLFLLWLLFTCCLTFVFYFGHVNTGKQSVSERGTANHKVNKVIATGSSKPTLAFPLVTRQHSRVFSYHEDIASPLRIPYQILAGKRPLSKKFISIGISSVRRKKENYLLSTLQSVFSQSRESDVADMVLVVFLADWDPDVQQQVVQEVSDQFPKQLAGGRLLLVTSPRTAYPPLDGLKRNYGDPEDRVVFRSKQNVDYAFLTNFCAGLASYHLVLEDDVKCSRNFLLSIRWNLEVYAKPWTTISFSKLGYIGKLYHSSDLPALARFLLLFYDEMPCDWLLDHFFQSKAQTQVIRIRPSLFQHMGSFSSFNGGDNRLKDEEFREGLPGDNNPMAVLSTDMEVYNKNTLEVAYAGIGIFWGRNVTNGSHISMRFAQPALLRRVRISTGSTEHSGDILRRGYGEIGWRGAQTDHFEACETYHRIGNFSNGTLDVEGPRLRTRNAVDCLRIRVTEDQHEWLLVSELSIWIERADNATTGEPMK